MRSATIVSHAWVLNRSLVLGIKHTAMLSSPDTVNIPETLVWRGFAGFFKSENGTNITNVSCFVKNFLPRETLAVHKVLRLIFLAFFGKFDIEKTERNPWNLHTSTSAERANII
jgi:hypothetical protein